MAVSTQNPRFNHWVRALPKDPIKLLLDSASLPVRFFVFRDVLNDTSSDDFHALKRNLRTHQPRRLILNAQNGDMIWPLSTDLKGLSEEQVETLSFLLQLENLNELLDLGITRKQERVQVVLVHLLKQMDEDGRFPGRFFHQVQAVHLMHAFELEGSQHLERALRYILRSQTRSGAWSADHDSQEECLWTSLYTLWMLSQVKRLSTGKIFKSGSEYVFKNLLAPDKSTILPGLQQWDQLYTGYSGRAILHGGTLRVLETMAQAGVPLDRKLRKLLDWLEVQQLRNGHWPTIAGRDRRGDEMVTLRVLKVFRHYAPERIPDEWMDED